MVRTEKASQKAPLKLTNFLIKLKNYGFILSFAFLETFLLKIV